MKVLKILGLGLAAVVVLVVIAGVWIVWFGEPPVDVMTVGPAVRIDTRFHGEYFVAASLIEVVGNDGAPAFRVTSAKSDCKSELFVFAAGANDVPALATGSCKIEVPGDSPTFELKAGETYTFTLVAKSGFGYERRAIRRFTVPGSVEGR